MEEIEKVELQLNYRGEDYTVLVDIDTANVLLNDSDEADRFMQRELEEHQNNLPSTSGVNKTNVVWSTRRPTERDNEATEFFLSLREKYTEKFNDRKTLKSQIWLEIIKEMNEAGFCVGTGKEAIEKVRLKFANLQKQYLNYTSHVKKTGESQRDPPAFYNILHSILGEKHKVNPVRIEDTLSDTEETDDTDETKELPSATKKIKSRFHLKESSLKPKSASAQMVDLLKEQHETDSRERQQQFETLKTILTDQTRQREEFLDTFKQLVQIKNRKRRRSPSTED